MPSDTQVRQVAVYQGPAVRIDRLAPAQPPAGTDQGARATVSYTTGPGGYPFFAESFDVYLDGALVPSEPGPSGPDSCGDCDGVSWHSTQISLSTPGAAPLAAGRTPCVSCTPRATATTATAG